MIGAPAAAGKNQRSSPHDAAHRAAGGLVTDPADPAAALAAVIAQAQANHDLGPRRRALLDQADPASAT